MRLVVLYLARFAFTPTIRDYLQAIGRHSRCEVSYYNVDQPVDGIDFVYFDAVFVNFCVTSMARAPEPPAFFAPLVEALARFRGIKIAAVQDEYDFTDEVKRFFLAIQVNAVLTNVPPAGISRVYGEAFASVRFDTVRTAYLPYDPPHKMSRLAERPIALGYRGRELPYRLGDLGWHKAEVGRRFKAACERTRFVGYDIAVDEASRFQGDAWLDFVCSCRVMLGSPSGAEVFDFDGSLHRSMVARYHPGLAYEEVRAEVEARSLGIEMGQISARVLEAVWCRTALALVRGSYSGVIEADKHYLPIEPDYSNVYDVLHAINDVPAMQAMADRAWEHVRSDPANYYQSLVDRIDAAVPGKGLSQGCGALQLAVTDVPLGTDPYLIAQLVQARVDLRTTEQNLKDVLRAAAEDRLTVIREADGSYRVLRF